MMKFSFISGKGGVGKTTLAINSARLISRKSNVLLIDCDIINRGATYLIFPQENDRSLNDKFITISNIISNENYELLIKNRNLTKIRDRLFFIPVGYLNDNQKINTNNEKEIKVFLEKIEKIAEICNIEVVIFDCSPTLDNLIGNITKNTEFNLLITETTNVAFRGTEHLKSQLLEFYKVNPDTIHIILNKADEDYLFSELGSKYKNAIEKLLKVIDVIGIIPYDDRIIKTFEEENKFFIDTISKSLATKQLENILYNLTKNTELDSNLIFGKHLEAGSIKLRTIERIIFRLRKFFIPLLGFYFMIIAFFVTISELNYYLSPTLIIVLLLYLIGILMVMYNLVRKV